jgi:Protein of unknown function (DUF5132)
MALGFRTGLLTGVGFSLVAALLLPRWGRPAAKAAIKGGIATYETASETLAHLRETLSDIMAEAAFERATEYQKAAEAERAEATSTSAERQKQDGAQPATAS